LKIQIISKEKVVFEKVINVSVEAKEEFNVDVKPDYFIAFLSGKEQPITILVKNSHDEVVSGAKVNIYLGGDKVISGLTTADGIFVSEDLPSPSPGSVIKVEIIKPGYKVFEKEFVVNENIISFLPSSIKDGINLEIPIYGDSVEKTIRLKNNSLIDVKIDRIVLSGALSDYVSIDFSGSFSVLAAGEEEKYDYVVNLRNSAKLLTKEQKIDGTLVFYVEANDKNWVIELPIHVYFVLGESLDDSSCLSVTKKISFVGEDVGKAIVRNLSISNGCSADNEPVEISNVKATLLWDGEEMGSFYFVDESGRNIKIEHTAQLNPLGKEELQNYRVFFVPSKKGSSKGRILIEATYASKEKVEKIRKYVEFNAAISKIGECIKTSRDEITMRICQQQGMLSFAQSQYRSALSQIYYPYGGAFFFQPQYGEVCNSAKFTLINECSFDVDVSLAADGPISVSSSKLTLKKGESKEIKVNATYLAGKFGLKISAKLPNTETYREIKQVKVNVYRKSPNELEDCIELSEDTIDVTNTTYYDKFYIVNHCYNKGIDIKDVKVSWIDEPGAMSDIVFVDSLTGQKISPGVKAYSQIVNIRKVSKVVTPEGDQIVRFRIRVNPNIRVQQRKPVKPMPGMSGLLQAFSVLRSSAVNSYLSANLTAEISITATSPDIFTKQLSTTKILKIIDNVQWLDATAGIDRLALGAKGDLKLQDYQRCMKNIVYPIELNQEIFEKIKAAGRNTINIIDTELCGTASKFTIVSTSCENDIVKAVFSYNKSSVKFDLFFKRQYSRPFMLQCSIKGFLERGLEYDGR